jgi:hypothetical protein
MTCCVISGEYRLPHTRKSTAFASEDPHGVIFWLLTGSRER